ncbi:hypothetical protein GCK32_008356 [Trichostrongylus colubriformis]|uniref:Uncharacterized protein n=1 Tax=Trichostrongylus colubriformis TaxID=6319 RepID=A0AAN8FHN9_TRICO
MVVGWLIVEFILFAIVKQEDPLKRSLPRLNPDTPFLPRALTYLSHFFSLRDDTTSFAFGKEGSEQQIDPLGIKATLQQEVTQR